jgi:two-component system LytT family sensor kinase
MMNTKLNKTDFILLGIYFLVNTSIGIYDYSIRQSVLLREYFIDFPLDIFLTMVLIASVLYWIIPKYIMSEKKYISFIFWSLILLSTIGIIERLTGYWSGGNDWSKFNDSYFQIFLNGINRGSNLLGLPLGFLLTKKFYESQTQIIEAEKQQKENELKLLRSQIDPHFLFNNLNTLDSLIDSNPEKAKEYISRLSLIYRYLIKTKDAEVMELISEIEFAENYIFLMKIRFGEDYEFVIEKNISLVDKYIPTGALQSLLENVVKHNKSDGKNVIKTAISINEGWLIITNSKATLASKNESFGTGLENLKARYQLLSDKKIQVHNMAKKFEVSIPIIELSS